jgi:hypothetical protein
MIPIHVKKPLFSVYGALLDGKGSPSLMVGYEGWSLGVRHGNSLK